MHGHFFFSNWAERDKKRVSFSFHFANRDQFKRERFFFLKKKLAGNCQLYASRLRHRLENWTLEATARVEYSKKESGFLIFFECDRSWTVNKQPTNQCVLQHSAKTRVKSHFTTGGNEGKKTRVPPFFLFPFPLFCCVPRDNSSRAAQFDSGTIIQRVAGTRGRITMTTGEGSGGTKEFCNCK